MELRPDSPHFDYRDGVLHCEELPVPDLCRTHGTPLYIYSARAMRERFVALREAFGAEARICYAVKANSNLHLLRLFAELGAGFDIVSGGELERLVAAGVDPREAVFAGVAKAPWEVEAALQAGIFLFNLESDFEVDLLEATGARLGRRVPLALRLNVDVEANTHEYITTAKKQNKFGLSLEDAARVIQRTRACPHLELKGYHVHLGSLLRQGGPYLEAMERVFAFMDADPSHHQGVEYYDCGGGFGISYGDGLGPLDVAALAAEMLPRLASRGLRPILEPGRFLVGDAGILVGQVMGVKEAGGRHFALVDAAMNDLLRPSLYGAEHPVAAVEEPAGAPPAELYDVVGPVCESADFLAKGRRLAGVTPGGWLAVFAAGAYGSSMACNYNSRRRPAEVLVDGDQVRLIRRRERFADLWAEELDA